jgi:outer membrane protein
MRRTLIASLLSLGLVPTVQAADAPGVDVTAEAYGWDAQPSGTFKSTRIPGDDEIDVEDDLDFGSNRNNVFSVALEHPVPLVPNVRVGAADISDSQNSTLNRSITYNNQTFNASERVSSEYQLDYTEATLYYSPWETVAKIDIGLTARQIDAKFAIESRDNNQSESVAAEATLPMIHAGVRADLPLTGFYVDGQVDAVSYDGNSLTDLKAAVGWQSDFLLGVEAGYRRMALTLDDVEDLDADFNLGGPYLALSVAI